MNYHHLRLFWTIAHSGGLLAAARRLNLSPSALSVQLKTLEARLGHALFERVGRRLLLTEAGRITLDHADTIFATGDELMATLKGVTPGARRLRIGAQTTLSRNFQSAFLAPVLAQEDVALSLRAGTLKSLVADLEAQTLDLVLANEPAPTEAASTLSTRLIDEQPVAFVGPPGDPLAFPMDFADRPLVLPSRDSDIRRAFDRLCAAVGFEPRVHAEADDMALLRLIARDTAALTLVPPIVVRDELADGRLTERCRLPDLSERFYALYPKRRFPNPLLIELFL
ncbi:LysR family transcriptional regulator [Sandaracinobacteroides saxicola]|uniref:LysR family transcriptional regulator n=1 Tax=Sandaracinobacteroides saxicola TaxID=2759707 RepID=A0A7G5ILE9_9SPHN|nr:LysR family transcriptional regulator [Sandaracinobacteroides saxicola]QMW24191.1 LysR family transcriptional regulator [Sandaracinobacteroides saxicola]